MIRPHICATLLVVLLLVALPATAGTISALTILYFGHTGYPLSFQVAGYSLVSFDPSQHVGETFWFAGDADSPCYSYAVMAITDGNWDTIMICNYGGGVGHCTYDFPGVSGTGNQDFIGYHIDRIGVSIDGYYELWDRWNFTPMIEYSEIPEPASLLALLCGVGGTGGLIWRRRSA